MCIFFIVVYLGTWQMQRSKEKEKIIAKYDELLQIDAYELQNVIDNANANRFTPVKLRAKFDTSHYFLLDNQIHDHQVGYKLIMPTVYNNHMLLIDRGFIKKSSIGGIDDAAESPIYDLKGYINQPITGIVLRKDNFLASDPWPRIIQNIDIKAMGEMLHHELLPFVIQLYADSPASKTAIKPSFGIPPIKHISYAIQWFSLAALIVVYYLIFFFKVWCRNDSSKE